MPEAIADRLVTTLDHRFTQPTLLIEALTHASAVPRGAAPKALARHGYERLEFLGDRVLGLVIAELLWRRFPTEAEGALTRRHTQLVRRETLAAVARAINLSPHIIMSAGEDGARTREVPGVLADVLEAVIAALYLDGGLAVARAFIERHWGVLLEEGGAPPRDPKTALQEWAQGRGRPLPRYSTTGIAGPPHERRFTVMVEVSGLAPESAEGSSKRAAEVAAASALLGRIEAGER